MVGLGTRSTIERVEIGNSRPKAARASALPDSRALVAQYRAVVSRRAALACTTQIQWLTLLETYDRNPLLTPDSYEGF
jgi:hypothetical protein